ncbi:DUF4258 domain-containing protein [Ferruginibacter sp. SUN002]|uniref:DUF4258 domain-containing protein n=1 Tax=Ferruginibacter sp. SUN002 TaxID=2937789 RepID=UPI003D36FBA1
MIKKYIPYILLLLAAGLLYYTKTHQRGKTSIQTEDTITVPAEPSSSFNRNTNKLIYSKHALCRMECRHIDESEVKEILANGEVNYDKIEKDDRGRTYPLEGVTHDKQKVRVVFAPKRDSELVVVTVIDLDRDWHCDCK